jgi:hypothetical protein
LARHASRADVAKCDYKPDELFEKLDVAAASVIATVLLWVAMPETRPAKYLD